MPERAGRRWRPVAAVAWRFLGGRRRSRLLDGTARSALVATAIGVAAMVIAMALMSGYRQDLQHKLVGGNAAVIAYPLTGEALVLSAAQRERLAAVPGLERYRRVAYAQGSIASAALPTGLDVTLRGVEPGAASDLLGVVERWTGELAPGVEPVLVGRELAEELAAEPGEVLRLMVLAVERGRPRFRYASVALAGTFRSGFSEFDRRLAVVDRERLDGWVGTELGSAVYEFVIAEGTRTAGATDEIRELLGPDFLVRDWREINSELFSALELQQLALFFVLGLIVLVSTFNVASSLVVLVRERMREIGVLAAMGFRPRDLQAVFLFFGGFLSAVGTACGVTVGVVTAWLLTRFELIRFDPDVAEIYFLSSVVFRVRWQDLAAVVAFTLAVTVLSCWLPARRAGRVRPAVALRYE